MHVTLDCMNARFVRRDKEIESSDSRNSSGKKRIRGYGGANDRLAESGVGCGLESGGRFCVDAFETNLVRLTVKVFAHQFIS
jgi:hypothetical protein